MVFFWTWFAAAEASEPEQSDDEQSTLDKAAELLKTGVEKAQPVAAKAGELAVEGAKKAGTAAASGSRWLIGKVRELIDKRKDGSGAEAEEAAPEAESAPEGEEGPETTG